jgi:hypothetical protein
MAKITIDTSKWLIPSQYAKEKKVDRNVVSNWIKRGKLEVWEIKELGIKLIKK